jgi:C-terminal processing protease CtpA/Prc
MNATKEVPRKVVYDTVVDLIRKRGIPSYVAAWSRDLVPFRDLPSEKRVTDAEFLKALSDRVVKRYHFHSSMSYHATDPVGKPKSASWGKKPPLIKDLDGGRLGYIRFYACSHRMDRAADERELARQTEAVASAVRAWRARPIDGLVIDLRWHSGGDIYPFVVGLASILEGVSMYSWGNVPAARNLPDWEIGGKRPRTGTFTTDRLRCRFPIAVLVGPRTGSAGEADAAMLYNKPDVKTFGQATSGHLSGNVVLPVHGSIELVITEVLVTTSDGTFHEDQLLKPNVVTSRPMQDAVAWINEHGRVGRPR